MSVSMSKPASSTYVVGEPHPNSRSVATFETKPSVAEYTGGGYEHWRSVEYRPHTPTQGSEDVYVSHHRLLAVVACYPSDEPLSEVLDDLREKDVHHESGVPWDNRPANLTVVEHDRHAEITQTQRLTWAEDARREVEQAEQQPLGVDVSTCDRCGCETDRLAECDGWPGERRCLDCAKQTADGEVIRL